MKRKVALFLAAGGLLLLPFLVNPWGGIMELQFRGPKLMAAFLLGNLLLAFELERIFHRAVSFMHAAFALSVVATGFGGMQLYPFVYWMAGLGLCSWYARLKVGEAALLRKAIYLSAALSSLHAIAQVAGLEPAANAMLRKALPDALHPFLLAYAPGVDQRLPIAYIGQRTLFGAFVAPLSGAALVECWPLAIPIIIAALLTHSSFTWLALGGSLFIASRRWLSARTLGWVFFSGCLALAAAWFSFPDATRFNADGRIGIWWDTYHAWKDHGWGHRIFGWGPGSFQAGFSSTFESKQEHDWYGDFLQTHNDYLNALFDLGLLGFLPILYTLYSLASTYWSHWLKWPHWQLFRFFGGPTEVLAMQAVTAGFLLDALGNFPYQLSPQYLVAMLFSLPLLKHARQV